MGGIQAYHRLPPAEIPFKVVFLSLRQGTHDQTTLERLMTRTRPSGDGGKRPGFRHAGLKGGRAPFLLPFWFFLLFLSFIFPFITAKGNKEMDHPSPLSSRQHNKANSNFSPFSFSLSNGQPKYKPPQKFSPFFPL